MTRRPRRPTRADARRNIDTLLRAAETVFSISGVDAPMQVIAERAGVGIGTLYRHFPQRSDLIGALFRHEIDACARAASALAAEHEPGEALSRWMLHYVNLIVDKRGLAGALCPGSPFYDALSAHFHEPLRPVLRKLLAAAVSAGKVRADIKPCDLLRAIAPLCTAAHYGDVTYVRRMVALLVDGLRYRAAEPGHTCCGAPH